MNRDGNPYLGLHGVFGRAEEGLDMQVLFDPFEEQFHLPAAFVELCNGDRWQRKTVDEEQREYVLLNELVAKTIRRDQKLGFTMVGTWDLADGLRFEDDRTKERLHKALGGATVGPNNAQSGRTYDVGTKRPDRMAQDPCIKILSSCCPPSGKCSRAMASGRSLSWITHNTS